MYNITIETAASYAGKSDTYTIEQGDKSIPVTHEAGGFMNKNVKPKTKLVIAFNVNPFLEANALILSTSKEE